MKYIIIGKFNPPHLGHAITIMRCIEKYKDITICVTDDKPINATFTQEEIAIEMSAFGVPVILFKGVLTKQLTDPFPECIYLTGNDDVINWAKKIGAKAEFIPRSGNISGTRIRSTT